ncbi:hypothetical protein [Sinomonas susongensis]|uniref:hypothetical protein n=1 Tax=Sinomonas susongensis TaxID=1324851 RepID=UPI0011098E86|nr:hypothetical protein [Sinomonas susongensis]
MAPQQFLLRGPSLEDITRQAAELYGSDARIVSADRVLDSGLGGLLGRRHIEATVVLPDPVVRLLPAVEPDIPHALGARAGIAALLDDADTAEDRLRTSAFPAAASPAPAVSTEAEDFDALLERLRGEMEAPAERVPVLLGGAGDLVLVIGPGETPFSVVRSMAAREPGAYSPVSAGETPAGEPPAGERLEEDWPHLEDVRDATAARAQGVESSTAVLAALRLRAFDRLGSQLGRAAALRPDQVWLAVDARHKPDETAEWVEAARSRFSVTALAVVGALETLSPQTVNSLGIPVGWVDSSPAPRTVL